MHSATGKSPQTQAYRYVYDHAGRLTHTYYKYDTNPEFLLAQQQYDELGRLQTKKQHGSAIDPTVYAYNIRGWVKEITNNRFTQNLYYNTGYGTPCYNGNISSMTWKAGTESTMRGYKFIYDKLSRLSEANYGEGTTITANSNRSFSEIVTAYDKHGNMQGLKRYGNTGSSNKLIDDLSFGYMGNQLKYVNDAIAETAVNQSFHFMDKSKSTGNEFTYDGNGNMVTDNNKNITNIQYNILNLPRKVQLSTGGLVKYTYDAAGIKHNVTHQGAGVNKSTDYCGTVIYENGILNKILTEEGYITFVGTTPTYHYYLKDHLGNNRVVLHQNGSTVEQVNHYYPFGGLFDQTAETLQTYKYNGKELDRTYDIDLYDYSARYMDGALGRFTTMDPMAEKYYGISPYAYCANNPMRFVDPTGKDILVLIWSSNNNRSGHAGIAISNYKQVNVTDSNGNIVHDENGNPQTQMVSDGTYTYRDLWPKESISLLDRTITSQADYQSGNITLDDAINNDVTNLFTYGEPADGLIKLETNYNTDQNVNKSLNEFEQKRTIFSPERWNCSTYVKDGINASGANVSREEPIIPGVTAVTPNRLFRDTKLLKNASVLKEPNVDLNTPWLQRRISSSKK